MNPPEMRLAVVAHQRVVEARVVDVGFRERSTGLKLWLPFAAADLGAVEEGEIHARTINVNLIEERRGPMGRCVCCAPDGDAVDDLDRREAATFEDPDVVRP